METTTLHLVPEPQEAAPREPRRRGLLQRGTPRRLRTQRRRGAAGRVPAPLITIRRVAGRFAREERGAVTAEYAIVILAAVAFAGLLVAIMQSAEIRAMLVQLVENALGSGS